MIFRAAGPHEWRRLAPVCQKWAEIIRHQISADIRMAKRIPLYSGPIVRPSKMTVSWPHLIELTRNVSGCACEGPDVIGLLCNKMSRGVTRALNSSLTPAELRAVNFDPDQLSFGEIIPNAITCVIWAAMPNITLLADIIELLIEQCAAAGVDMTTRDFNPAAEQGSVQKIFDLIFWTIEPSFMEKMQHVLIYWIIYRIRRIRIRDFALESNLDKIHSADGRDVFIAIAAMTIPLFRIKTLIPDSVHYIKAIQRPATREFVAHQWEIDSLPDDI